MVKASYNRKHILPILYNICDDEFNNYVENLECAGFIKRRISDGITYYDATIKESNINNSFILNAIKAVSDGVTTALLNKIGA